MSECHRNARLSATKAGGQVFCDTGPACFPSRARFIVAGCEQMRITACWLAPGWLLRSCPQDRVLQLQVIPCVNMPIVESVSVSLLPE